MLDPKIREVARKIGEFYLQKNNKDYDKTADEILNLRITKLEDNSDKICITLARPSMLIGKRGEQIDQLESYIGRKISIIEDPDGLIDCIIPYPPYEDEKYDYSMYYLDDETDEEMEWRDIQDDYDYYR